MEKVVAQFGQAGPPLRINLTQRSSCRVGLINFDCRAQKAASCFAETDGNRRDDTSRWINRSNKTCYS